MNRNAKLTERKLARALHLRAEWRVLPAAFLATLLALPVNAAITIPTDPLASGVRVAPNILFILDDSGSMAYDYMPDSVPSTSSPNISRYTYARNTIYYNPTVTYEPWVKADGNRMTGGTSYGAVFASYNKVQTQTIDLRDPASCRWYNNGDDATNDTYAKATDTQSQKGTMVCGGVQPFLVPTGPLANQAQGSGYYLYQIMTDQTLQRGSHGDISRSGQASVAMTSASGTATNTTITAESVSVTAGWELEVNVTSTQNRALVYRVFDPNGAVVCEGTAQNNSKTCRVNKAVAGKYQVALWRGGNDNVGYTITMDRWSTSNRCAGDPSPAGQTKGYINCATVASPWVRTNGSTEAQNYATWFSYYRTRMKAAKAGASDAFRSLGNKARVGFRTIWQRNYYPNSKTSFAKPIPVDDGNEGRFVDNTDLTTGIPATTTRSDWYATMQAAIGSSATPLHGALDKAGAYYQDSTGTGPYGPLGTGSSQYSCRQNFTILTTDGYWNSTSNYSGTLSGGTWTNGVGEQDDADGSTITGPNGASYTYNASSDRKWPFIGSDSGTLADVAMKYWKTDLRTDLTNNVPKTDTDPAFWQHMVTFGISIGLAGTRGWRSVEEAQNATVNKTWPNPNDAENNDRIDDLLHAAVNGHGAFVSASSPQEFADGLEQALSKINERTAAFSNVGASDSTQLTSGTLIFYASYVSGKWTGSLRAENAVSGAPIWNTTTTTPSVFPAYGSRKVITRGGTLTDGRGATGTLGGATFPTSQQETALTRGGGPANYAVSGADNALYIKGDTTNAGVAPGKLRTRTTMMGDIVNSSPAYAAETNTVYIGSNDGMLHAFNAATGAEQFAYIPGIINFGYLAELSRRDYDHRWFVDGPIVISPRSLSPNGDKNILIGTLGRGGKGLYALDVTTPASFGTGNVMWERSTTSATPADDNMGMVLGAPVLAKVRGGSPTTSAVILGNGITEERAKDKDGNYIGQVKGSDKAALLVLNMNDGSIIREIPAGTDTANGLFAPTVIYAADGRTAVYAYAGDLKGNVWKFDLTSSTPASWSARKIFTAEKTAGTPQPITAGIASAVDPRTNTRWIFFATGSFLTLADGNDVGTDKQSIYAVMDDLPVGGTTYTRSNLTSRSVGDGTGTDADERYFQNLTSITNKGWYVDLPGKGERIVQNAQIDGSYLVTASMMPSGDSCADAQGSGYVNALSLFPGMLAGGKSYFDRNNDGYTDDSGTSSDSGNKPTGSVKTVGMPTLPLLLPGEYKCQTSTGESCEGAKGRPRWNRVSWRELRND